MESYRSRLDRGISRSVSSLPRYQSPSPARSLSGHRLDSIWNHSRSRERLCYIGNAGPVRVINSYNLHHSPSPRRTYQVILCSTKTNQTFTRVTRSLSQYDVNSSHMYTSQDSLFDGSLASATSSQSVKEAVAVRRAESCEDIFRHKASFFSDATPSESGVSFGESEEGSTCGADEDNLSLHSLDGSSAFFEATVDSEHEKGDTDHLSSTDCTGDRIISSVRESRDRTSSKLGEHKRHQKLRPTDSGYGTSSRSGKNKATSSSSAASKTSATTKDQASYEALRVIIPDHDSSTENLDHAMGRKASSTPLAHSTPHVSPSGKEEHRFQVFASWNADEKLEERTERKSSSADRASAGSKMSSRSRTGWPRFEDSSYHSSGSDDYSSDLSNNWTPAVVPPRKTRLVKKSSDRAVKVSSQAVHVDSSSPPGPGDSIDSATSKRSKDLDRTSTKNNYTEDEATMRDRHVSNVAENAATEYTNGVFFSKESDDWWKDYANQETEAKNEEETEDQEESSSVSQRGSLVDIPLVAEIPLISAGKYGQAKLRRPSKTSPSSTPARSQSPPTLAETNLAWGAVKDDRLRRQSETGVIEKTALRDQAGEDVKDEQPRWLSETGVIKKTVLREQAGEVAKLNDPTSRNLIHNVGLKIETEKADEQIDDLEAESHCHAETNIDERDTDLGNGNTETTSSARDLSREWGFPLGILEKSFEKITPTMCNDVEDTLVRGQENTLESGNKRESYEIVGGIAETEVVKPNDRDFNLSGIFEDNKAVEVDNSFQEVVNISGNEDTDTTLKSEDNLNQTSTENKVVELRGHEEVVKTQITTLAKHEITDRVVISEPEVGSTEICGLQRANSDGREMSEAQERPVLGSRVEDQSGQILEDISYRSTCTESEDFVEISEQYLEKPLQIELETKGSEVIECGEVDFQSCDDSKESEAIQDILVQEGVFSAVEDESGQARLSNQQANMQTSSLIEVCISEKAENICAKNEGRKLNTIVADLKVVSENETPDKCDLETSTMVVFAREGPESKETAVAQETLLFGSQVEDHNGLILGDVSYNNTYDDVQGFAKISVQEPEKRVGIPLEAGRSEVTEYGEVNVQTCDESNRSGNLEEILVQKNEYEVVAGELHQPTPCSEKLNVQTASLIDTCESLNTEDRGTKNEGIAAKNLFAELAAVSESEAVDTFDLNNSHQNIHVSEVTGEFDSVLTKRQLKQEGPAKVGQEKLKLGLQLAGGTHVEEEVDLYAINRGDGTKDSKDNSQNSDGIKSPIKSLKTEFGAIQTYDLVSVDVLHDNVSSVGIEDEPVQKGNIGSSLQETDLDTSSSQRQLNIGVSSTENLGLFEVKGERRTEEMLGDSEKLQAICQLKEPSLNQVESKQKEEARPTTNTLVRSTDVVETDEIKLNEHSLRLSDSNLAFIYDQREYSSKEAVLNQSSIQTEETTMLKQPPVLEIYPGQQHASEATTSKITRGTHSTSPPKTTTLASVSSVIATESQIETLAQLPHTTFTEVSNMTVVEEERDTKEANANQPLKTLLSLAVVSPLAGIQEKPEIKHLVRSPLSESYETKLIQEEEVAQSITGSNDQQNEGSVITLEFEVKRDPFVLTLVRVHSHANQEQIAEESLTTTDLPSVRVNSRDCLRLESQQEPRFIRVDTLESFVSQRQTLADLGKPEFCVHQSETVITGVEASECRNEPTSTAEVSVISLKDLAQNIPESIQTAEESSVLTVESINDIVVQAESRQCDGVPVTVTGIQVESQKSPENITPILLTPEKRVYTEQRSNVTETIQPIGDRDEKFPSVVIVESSLNTELTPPAVSPVVVTRLGNSQPINAEIGDLEIKLEAVSRLSKFRENLSRETPPLQKQLPDDENSISVDVLNRVALLETLVVRQDSLDGDEVVVDKVEFCESVKASTTSGIKTVPEEPDRTYKARLVFLQPLQDSASQPDGDAIDGSSSSLSSSEDHRRDRHISTVPGASLDSILFCGEKVDDKNASEELASPSGIYNAKMTYISPFDQLEAHLTSLAQDEFYSSEMTGEIFQDYDAASGVDSESIIFNQRDYSTVDYRQMTNTDELEKPPVKMNMKWDKSEDISKESLCFADSYSEVPDKDYDNLTTEMCDTDYDNVTGNTYTSRYGRLVETSQRRTSQAKLSKLGTLREETEISSSSASPGSTHKIDPVTLLHGVDGGGSYQRRWQRDLNSTNINVAGPEPMNILASTRRISDTTSAPASADRRDRVQDINASLATKYKRDLSAGIKTSTLQNDGQNNTFSSTSVPKESASVPAHAFAKLLDEVTKASAVNPDRARESFQYESKSDFQTPKVSVSNRVSPSKTSVAEKVSALEQLASTLDRCGGQSSDSSLSWKPTGLSQKLIDVYNATEKVPKLIDGSGSSVDPEISRSSVPSSASADTRSSPLYTSAGRAEVKKFSYLRFDSPVDTSVAKRKPSISPTPIKRAEKQKESDNFDKILDEFDKNALEAISEFIFVRKIPAVSKGAPTSSSSSSTATTSDDLYKTFTHENSEKKQNHICIVIEDDNMSTFRFKRYLKKAHVKRKKGEKILSFLSRLAGVPEAAGTPLSTLYHRLKQSNKGTRTFSTDSMPRISDPILVSSTSAYTQNVLEPTPVPQPTYAGNASFTSINSKGSFRDSTDSAYSSLSGSISGIPETPGLQRSSHSTFFASPVRFGSVSSVFHSGSTSGGDWSYSDTDFPSGCDVTTGSSTTSGAQDRPSLHKLEESTTTTASTTASLSDVFEQLNDCQEEIDSALLNRYQYGHFRTQGDQHKSLETHF